MVNWHDLATTSHYQTAVAIKHALSAGDIEHARIGIEEIIEALIRADRRAEEIIEALIRADRRALESYLIRLMQHIIKWRVQPERRSPSWAATIRTARRQIAHLQRETPSLSRWVIEAMWDDALLDALDEVEGELNRRIPPVTLTWDEVFETEYSVERD
jgi:hypothetical protein